METRFDELVNEILIQNTIDENFLKNLGKKALPYVAAGAIGAGFGLGGKSTKPVKPEDKRPVPIQTISPKKANVKSFDQWRSQEDISLKKKEQQEAREKMMQQKTGKTKEQREQRLKDVSRFIDSQNK